MKKLLGLLLVVLAVLTLSFGCSDSVTGPKDPREGTPVPTPSAGHPRPTPNPCRQNPADC